MRYIIVGAGAVGGTIGARLFQAGHEVVLMARGAHYQALRSGGLRFATPEGVATLPIPAVTEPGQVSLRDGDALVLTVKTQDATGVLDAWAGQPVAGGGVAAAGIPVFCALNGVTSERLALRRFRQVYGVCVWLPASHLEPGAVDSQGTPLSGLLPLGRYPAGIDETAQRVAADLAGSLFVAPVSADVMRWKYGKLLTNLGNAVEAVCGSIREPGPHVEGATDLARRARSEGAAVLRAAGIPCASQAEIAGLRGDQVQTRPANGARRSGGSSWQSLTRGTGSIEADYLNGEIALLGRLHGVPAPVNEMLQRMANQFARERRAPGTVTPAELAALTTA